MKKKSDQLDHIVKDKLNQFRVSYNPKHWAQFEQMLDKQEGGVPIIDNRALDEVVFDKLHNVKAGDRAAHWDKLAARMNEQVDVRQRLLLHKLMESALILLLILIVARQLPLHSPVSPAPEKPIAQQQHAPTLHANKTSAEIPANNDQTDLKATIELLSSSSTLKETTYNQTNKYTDITNTSEEKKTASIVEKEASNTTFTPTTFASPTLSKSILPKPISKQEPIALKSDKEFADYQSVVPHRLELLNALEQIMLSELEHNAQPGYVELISPIQPRTNWVVSMFGSGDYNQVITPRSTDADRIYEKWLRYAPGYSGGITAGLDFGRWEIGGGAIYMAKKYERRPIVYLGGSFFDPYYEGEGLKYIELNMVQLPLYFRYNFIHHDKWRAYATMGFALQVNFQTNYYYADANAFDTDLPRPLPRPDQAHLQSETLPGGWLDGGSLWQNGYISGNVGLGLERYITGRWSVFTQPTYHHSLNYFTQGIGPDKDRLNTMSIFAGVRVRLND